MVRRGPGPGRRSPTGGCSTAVRSGDAPGCSAPARGCSGMLWTGPGMVRTGPGMLRDALDRPGDGPPPRPGDASPVKSTDAPVGCGAETLRRVRVGGCAGAVRAAREPHAPRCRSYSRRRSAPGKHRRAGSVNGRHRPPPGPLAAGRGEITGSANGRPPERGCWREWQGGAPRPRRHGTPGSSPCPPLSSAASPVTAGTFTRPSRCPGLGTPVPPRALRDPPGDAPTTASTRSSPGLGTPVSPVPPTPAHVGPSRTTPPGAAWTPPLPVLPTLPGPPGSGQPPCGPAGARSPRFPAAWEGRCLPGRVSPPPGPAASPRGSAAGGSERGGGWVGGTGPALPTGRPRGSPR
ncbi:splicing factor, proline- and glutamine-rich-like [Accipiter gentilis]|uniref:splicing factor, proline- and glutamine-rich-like n=1 Tax=Astur gentilis TaxID=8957 RepID=UPI0021101E00|nr:splicing factor, proline- and glutamine-rich-like [Accipiter gentilis]